MMKANATLLLLHLLLLPLLIALPAAAEEAPIDEPPKSPGLAGMLSFFIPGAGHFYCGEVRTGTHYLVGTVALGAGTVALFADSISDEGSGRMALTAGLLAGTLVLHGADVVHAVRTARRINLELGPGAGPRGQAALMICGRF